MVRKGNSIGAVVLVVLGVFFITGWSWVAEAAGTTSEPKTDRRIIITN